MLRRVIFTGFLVSLLSFVIVVHSSTNAEARPYPEVIAEMQAVLADPNCRSKEFIDALIQEANQAVYNLYNYRRVGRPSTTRGNYLVPGIPRAEGDDAKLKRLAAHLPEKICPAPEPVKLYSVGTRYTPAPIQPFIGIEGGIERSNANFNVSPPFDVNGTGGVYGINGGLLFPIPGTPFAVGPRIGVLWGGVGGSTANPPASPFFTYSVNTKTIVTGEMEFAMNMRGYVSDTIEPFHRLQAQLGVGWADCFLDVNGTSGGFAVNDSKWHPGFTASAALVLPIADTPLDLMLRYRWINVQSANHNIPGSVPISGNINLVTLGVQWNLGGPTTPAR